MTINEERASDFINTQERIDEVRQYTRDLMTTFEVDRKPGWWTTPMKRHNGKVVVPVEAIEDDLYHFFLLSNFFYTNEFEPGIARIAITELEFDLSQRFSKKFMLFKKIIEVIMTVDDEYLKYDNDLNGLSFEELREQYNDIILTDYNAMATRIEQRTYHRNKSYNVIKIESFEHAQLFYDYSNSYSPLCMTYSEFKYDSYTANGNNAMYFVIYKDIDDVEEPDIDYDNLSNKNFSVKSASWIDYSQMLADGYCSFPWDEYGMSLIVVIINTDGTLNTCIGRYNHALGSFARDYLDEEQLSIAVGGNFYEVFKPNEVAFEEEIKEDDSSVVESLDIESDFSYEDSDDNATQESDEFIARAPRNISNANDLITDENGNPYIFYHSYYRKDDSDKMYWLSTNYEFSKEFGDKTVECYIKSNSPKVFEDGILRYEDGSPVMFDDEPASIGYLDAVDDDYIEYLMDNYDCIMDDTGEFTVIFSRDNMITDKKW